MTQRIILIVLDSAGVGALPDAAKYGDENTNTIGNIAENLGGISLPNFQKFGLGNIIPLKGVEPLTKSIANFGKMDEKSAGKDTPTGHWEMTGIILTKPFPTYPDGFPADLIAKFCGVTGFKSVLGNCAASGTEIIKQFGEEHMKTGLPIVYTSADSVFQIAAHEEIIPIEKLYDICVKARSVLTGKHSIGRVIARPFLGKPGSFKRTEHRKDFSISPPEDTILDKLKNAGMDVIAVGKIEDIFNRKGITKIEHTGNNKDGIASTIKFIKEKNKGLIFTNLVDFDMVYGHRRDVKGYYDALKIFDDSIPEIIKNMNDDDVLMITADHGCDPTFTKTTDHTREYVPLLVYGKNLKNGINLKTRQSFADVGQTIADFLELQPLKNGTSFKKEIT